MTPWATSQSVSGNGPSQSAVPGNHSPTAYDASSSRYDAVSPGAASAGGPGVGASMGAGMGSGADYMTQYTNLPEPVHLHADLPYAIPAEDARMSAPETVPSGRDEKYALWPPMVSSYGVGSSTGASEAMMPPQGGGRLWLKSKRTWALIIALVIAIAVAVTIGVVFGLRNNNSTSSPAPSNGASGADNGGSGGGNNSTASTNGTVASSTPRLPLLRAMTLTDSPIGNVRVWLFHQSPTKGTMLLIRMGDTDIGVSHSEQGRVLTLGLAPIANTTFALTQTFASTNSTGNNTLALFYFHKSSSDTASRLTLAVSLLNCLEMTCREVNSASIAQITIPDALLAAGELPSIGVSEVLVPNGPQMSVYVRRAAKNAAQIGVWTVDLSALTASESTAPAGKSDTSDSTSIDTPLSDSSLVDGWGYYPGSSTGNNATIVRSMFTVISTSSGSAKLYHVTYAEDGSSSLYPLITETTTSYLRNLTITAIYCKKKFYVFTLPRAGGIIKMISYPRSALGANAVLNTASVAATDLNELPRVDASATPGTLSASCCTDSLQLVYWLGGNLARSETNNDGGWTVNAKVLVKDGEKTG